MKPGQFWGQCENSEQSIKILGDIITKFQTVPNFSGCWTSLSSQVYWNLNKHSLGIKRQKKPSRGFL